MNRERLALLVVEVVMTNKINREEDDNDREVGLLVIFAQFCY